MMWIGIGMAVALVLGVWTGLGLPGIKGRTDRVVEPGRARRLPHRYVHWIRPDRR